MRFTGELHRSLARRSKWLAKSLVPEWQVLREYKGERNSSAAASVVARLKRDATVRVAKFLGGVRIVESPLPAPRHGI